MKRAVDIIKKLQEATENSGEYQIAVKVVFDGTATVKADSEEDAKNKAEEYINATLGNVNVQADDIVDWEIDMHGYCYTNLVEDDE